jgi:hypothetical protein
MDPIAGLNAGKKAFAAMLARMSGASQHRSGDLSWIDTGVAEPVFNGVYEGRDVQPAGIDHVVGYFRDRGLPFHWELGLRGEEPWIPEMLVTRGLERDGDEPAMALDLSSPPEPPPTVPALVVQPVTTDSDLRIWVDVWGCRAPIEVIERWWNVYRGLPYGPDGPCACSLHI